MQSIVSKIIHNTLVIIMFGWLVISASAVATAAENGSKKSFGYSDHYGVVTPSQVYGLLQDYEKVFTYYVNNHKKGLATQVKRLDLKSVSGKTPGDAFKKLAHLSDVIDTLSASVQLPPMDRVKKEKAKVIPAEVFLQAGNCLDAFVAYMDKLEPNKHWGNFYVEREYKKGKSPSDVYALADLSVRRLALVMR